MVVMVARRKQAMATSLQKSDAGTGNTFSHQFAVLLLAYTPTPLAIYSILQNTPFPLFQLLAGYLLQTFCQHLHAGFGGNYHKIVVLK